MLIKIDEKEKKILFYPNHNLDEKPLERLIDESKEIFQLYKVIDSKKRFNYKDPENSRSKEYSVWKDFPSKKVVLTVNKSENRIYIYPDQDFSKPPLILDRTTGKRIQFYQKLHKEGEFRMKGIKFDLEIENKNKLAVVRLNNENNEIYVYLDGNMAENPFVFNKLTGERI